MQGSMASTDYSFRPHTTPLPKYYNGPRSFESKNFHQRSVEWKQHKEMGMQKEREAKVLHELDGCTFRPNVNKYKATYVPMSHRARKEAANVPTVQRLYENKQSRKHRQALVQMIQTEREMKFKKECTFTPTLNKDRKATGVGWSEELSEERSDEMPELTSRCRRPLSLSPSLLPSLPLPPTPPHQTAPAFPLGRALAVPPGQGSRQQVHGL